MFYLPNDVADGHAFACMLILVGRAQHKLREERKTPLMLNKKQVETGYTYNRQFTRCL